ncbi:MAG: Phosphatidylserine decarboxylase proenzyme [Syntrophorhabdus sp. PtaU1.Bin058]|nr:MAG: Phosphatidylserine decarboxylase proenzyme [Syntrophorhabdus sp. PtaU1.Bin058]
MTPHQYIERETLNISTERLYWDRVIGFLYSKVRENVPSLFRIVTGPRTSSLLGFLNYELFITGRLSGNMKFLKESGINLDECLEGPELLDTPKKIFERKIRYWKYRPMCENVQAVVSPADARVLVGSFCEGKGIFVKEKFFEYEELLGPDKGEWLEAFHDGDFAIFRLTPDKYHYNHTPVAGVVLDVYEISGRYHSCNPGAVIMTVTPYSKNKRVVTVIDTDVPGGSQVGRVAMVEVVAFMIGEIAQCYSEEQYDNPVNVSKGMFLERGCPKSLYRPGSSTDILIFQKDRVLFADDILINKHSREAMSRYSLGFGEPLVETDVKVRSLIAIRQSIV